MTGLTDHRSAASPPDDSSSQAHGSGQGGVPAPRRADRAAGSGKRRRSDNPAGSELNEPDDTDPAGPDVFSGGRLRACRDLAGLTRRQLASKTDLPIEVITAYEDGSRRPRKDHLARLADVLAVTPGLFTGPPAADDSWEYWGLICAAMPPMTGEQIVSVATVLRRIDQQRHAERSDEVGGV